MKTAGLGALLTYEGRLVRVIGIAEGRTLLLRPVEEVPCPTCRSEGVIHVLEQSRLFQDHAQPVETMGVIGRDRD